MFGNSFYSIWHFKLQGVDSSFFVLDEERSIRNKFYAMMILAKFAILCPTNNVLCI